MNMQEDAIRRVREMQRRANLAKDSANDSFGYQNSQHSEPVSQYNNYNYQQDSQREAPENNHNHQSQNVSSPQNQRQGNDSTQEEVRQNYQQNSQQTGNQNAREPTIERNENNSEPNANMNDNNREPNVNREEGPRNTHTEGNTNQRQNQNQNQSQSRNRNQNNTNSPFSNLFNDPTLKSIFGKEGLGNLSGIFGNNGLNVNAILEKISDPVKGEQILLLGMLILLSNEGADRVLLIAILYIMLD